MVAEWLALISMIETATSAKGLVDLLVGARQAEILDAVAEVDGETAALLIAEACDREGTARRVKLETALTLLEAALVAYDKATSRDGLNAWSYELRFNRMAERCRRGCGIAVLTAAVYAEFGDDEESVRARLVVARRMLERHAEAISVRHANQTLSATTGPYRLPWLEDLAHRQAESSVESLHRVVEHAERLLLAPVASDGSPVGSHSRASDTARPQRRESESPRLT